MALMKKIATQAQASRRRATAPLRVSAAPRRGDIRVRLYVQPAAPLGQLDVRVSLPDVRTEDDPALHAAIVRRITAHLGQYGRDFEAAAAAEDPCWAWRLCQAGALLDPAAAPAGEDAAGEPRPAPQRPCCYCGALSPWDACADCVPL
jgi:hypothetical protein